MKRVLTVVFVAAVIHMKVYNKANKALLCTGEHSKTWVDIRQRM